jgi:hypothetical protein
VVAAISTDYMGAGIEGECANNMFSRIYGHPTDFTTSRLMREAGSSLYEWMYVQNLVILSYSYKVANLSTFCFAL